MRRSCLVFDRARPRKEVSGGTEDSESASPFENGVGAGVWFVIGLVCILQSSVFSVPTSEMRTSTLLSRILPLPVEGRVGGRLGVESDFEPLTSILTVLSQTRLLDAVLCGSSLDSITCSCRNSSRRQSSHIGSRKVLCMVRLIEHDLNERSAASEASCASRVRGDDCGSPSVDARASNFGTALGETRC